MYRIEFKKINLEAEDETIGEVVLVERLGELVPKGVLYKTGQEFHSKEEAEMFAKQFEALYSKWPDLYKVTTEVYRATEQQ